MTPMTPEEVADELRGELEASLADSLGEARHLRVRQIRPPSDLGVDRAFVVLLEGDDGRQREFSLPAGLATAYLADEEAAVDEWRAWVDTVSEVLSAAHPSPD